MTKTEQRKPRTNDEAIDRFVENILSDKVGPYLSVNSMHLDGDVFYHYGHHYPCAMIVRKRRRTKGQPYSQDGKPVAVLINSTHWHGQSGWGWSTSGVVSSLRMLFKRIIEANGLDIPVYDFPLTEPRSGIIYMAPDENDPEPEIPALRDIPRVPRKNVPVNPGDEPVKDRNGWTAFGKRVEMECIAGTTFEAEYAGYSVVYDWERRKSSQSFITLRDNYNDGNLQRTRHVAGVERVYFGDSHWDRRTKPDGFEYKSCPHCQKFYEVHRCWYDMMNGRGHLMGWKEYVANIDKFGNPDAWREARSALAKLIKQREAEHAEWMKRNTIRASLIPKTQRGNVRVMDVNLDGTIDRAYAERLKRKDQARARREAREQRRKIREREARRKEEAKVRAEFRAKIEAGTLTEPIDPFIMDWLAEKNVNVDDKGLATLYKYVKATEREGAFVSDYRHTFEYHVGQWAIAEDYEPHSRCGNGLHFSESPETAPPRRGNVIIECKVPIVTLIGMGYKVKAERAFVVRVIEAPSSEMS